MKIVPDYLEGYLDTERTIFLLLFIGCLVGSYYLYTLQHQREKISNRVNKFATNVPKYQRLRKKLKSGRPTIPEELKENPLSFMERVVPQEFLTNLQPTNEGDQAGYQFQLRLDSKDVSKILNLVSTLEQEPLLKITQFSLIRESFESRRFHSVMKLRTLQ